MSFKKALIFYIIGFILWAAYSSDVYAKDGIKGNDDKEKVEELVTAYYEAHTAEGMETLQDYVEDGERAAEEIIVLKICLEHGVEKYDIVEVNAYPLSDEIHWCVTFSYELILEDFDEGIPGFTTLIVRKQKGGTFTIADEIVFMDDDKNEELIEEIRQIMSSDEMYDKMTDVAFAYSDILEENPDIREWVIEVSHELELTRARMKQAEDFTNQVSETITGAHKTYIVHEGDSLWSIAEEQLGCGMYWSSIYEDNRKLIGDDPNLIYVGWELKIDVDTDSTNT